MKRPQRTLVVDADIARAAGPDPKERPWSDAAKDAHDVLHTLQRGQGYRVLFDAKLLQEWKKHQGNTALAWFAAMLSARRISVVRSNDTGWIDELVRSQLPTQDQAVALKDSHLVALAHSPGDRRLLSNDGKAREKFARLAAPEVQMIHWVAASADARAWLLDGAPERAAWQLGARGGSV